MKKTLLIIVLAVMLLLSSCGNTMVVYQEVNAYRAGNASADVIEQWERGYTFKTKEFAEFVDEGTKKTVSFFEYSAEMECFAIKEYLGCDYQEAIYSDDLYMVFCHKDTQELVGIRSYYIETPIMQAVGLETEQDFIDYAKTIAENFIDVDEYAVQIIEQTPPEPGVTSGYRGDQYIFRKQLSGVDTAECLIVSITPEGAVGSIRHEAIGQFEDFEGIKLDPALIDSAVEKAINAATPQTAGRVDVKEYDYYLMNDGGTLLLYLKLTSTSTPIDEELTTDPANPVYREENTVSIGTVVVVPLAEVRK